MKKVLVTGANGMLGKDLCPLLAIEDYNVIETDINNLDITNIEQVDNVLKTEKPEIVIHCAAYTNVDNAEEDLETARLINFKGTENLAKVCANINAILVYVSTDYVFSGDSITPYKTTDIAFPMNNYGLTKFEGEQAVRNNCLKYYITRTSWLYGTYGENFVERMISLANKSELRVVNDQIGCPTWTIDLSNGIIKLLKENKPYGIYHVCGSGSTSWYGFAKEIFRQCGLNVNLKPCTTEEFMCLAKRPRYSVMDNNNICRDWKEALKDYIALRQKVGSR